ncbi:MAG: Crp/Fnr family transcriptional regulator [Oscillospiraceae bacterium]|nr:Crp/Fnr family transcriptional regulator [Oscillospiraceae bacterium]
MNRILHALPFWNGLTESEKQQIESFSITRAFPSGSIIHDGGKDCLGLLILLSGGARVYLPSPQGREITLFHLPKEEVCVLSASCVIEQITFDTIITAEEDCEVLVIPAGLVARLSEQNLHLRSYIYEKSTECFSAVMSVMQQLLFAGFNSRLAKFLIAALDYVGADTLYLTHEQIAQEINSAREVVARQLKRWSSEGIVTVGRGRVTVNNREYLENL